MLSMNRVMLFGRHYKLEADLAEMNWRVRWDDIMFGTLDKRKMERFGSRTSLTKVNCLEHSHFLLIILFHNDHNNALLTPLCVKARTSSSIHVQ